MKTKPIRGAELFWEAALDLFEHEWSGCCMAINSDYFSDEKQLFVKLFQDNINAYWMDSPEHTNKQNREHRVWAMLFMEQIYKDEND